MRKASSNWIGRSIMALVMGLLVASFAIWGIGDIFRGFGRSTAVKIGHTEITIDQLRQLYNDRLQQIGRQQNRPITLEQARLAGIDRIVIGQIISEFVLDERAHALRLGLSDAEISRRITTEPAFQSPTGQFDRTRFEQTIRELGFTEQRFVAQQRRESLRRQIIGTISSGPIVPKATIEAVDRFQNEQRSIEYVVLDRAQAGEVAAPTTEDLAKFFDERKTLFRAPEYRKIVLLSLIPSEQAQWIVISDDDAKRAYEDRKAKYTTPEKRHIQQMVFPSADDANAAAERIAKGVTFADIAKERGLNDKDIDLGTLTKTAVIDRAVANAAFELKEGEVSKPVQGRFGTAIVYVDKIEPEVVRPFEEVAAELKRDLAAERAKSETLTVYDKIEDARSEGKTLPEAAADLKLASTTVEVDRSGRDPSGAPVTNIPDSERVLSAAFSADAGVDNDALQVEGGYIWYEVSGVTPARDRTLDEVKDQVETQWGDEETAKRLQTKATEMLDKVKAGASLADVAAADKLQLQTLANLKRLDPTPALPPATIEAVFRTAKGEAATAATQGVEQVVFRVTDVVEPSLDEASADTKTIQDALNRTMTEEMINDYVSQIESEIGVNLNQSALRQVITGATVQDQDD